MSKITRTQNLGVSRWRNPKLATICKDSIQEGEGYQGPGTTYTLPCPMVASFGLRNRDIQDFSACVMSDADAGKSSYLTTRHGGLNILIEATSCELIRPLSLEHFHHKPMDIPKRLGWDCSNDTGFVSFMEMSFSDPLW